MTRKHLLLSLLVVMFCATFALAGKPRYKLGAYDSHPGARVRGTGDLITWIEGDPRFKLAPGSRCPDVGRHGILVGTVAGHPDPRLTDPNAVCGHGIVRIVGEAVGGTRPVSILPIIPAQASRSGPAAGAADASRIVRGVLPRIDRPEGDGIPAVVQLLEAVRTMDAVHASRYTPRRMRELE